MDFAHPFDKIEEFLQHVSQVTGIWCCYTDTEGRPVLLPAGKALFCTRMLQHSGGAARCMACMQSVCANAARSKHPFRTMRCHAGVGETAVPVYYRYERVGTILFSAIPIQHPPAHALESARGGLRSLALTDSMLRSYLHIRQMSAAETASCAQMLLNGVCAIYAEADPHAETCGLEQRLENYIRAHYTEKLTLERIAKALSVGKTKLCAVTAMHGSTVMTLVNEIRIEEAKRLLETTYLRIRDVSEQVGVADPNYFTKLFRAYTGETPRAYQKRLTNAPMPTAREGQV